MTFDTTEKSVESGKGLEFYRFNMGAEQYNLTSHDENVTFGGVVYTKTAGLSHSPRESAKEDEINTIEITIPSNHPVAQKFTNIIPGYRIFVDIWKTHRSEIGTTEEYGVVFEGFIASARYAGQLTCVLKCRPLSDVFRRKGPRYTYSVLCNHTLYDARCKLTRVNFKYDGTITAVTDDVITVNGASGLGADYFEGGYAEFPAGAGEDFRLILEQTGDDMRLLLPFADDAILNKTVRLFAGCKHNLTTCNSKFANALNFGGCPWVPPKNPFVLAELR